MTDGRCKVNNYLKEDKERNVYSFSNVLRCFLSCAFGMVIFDYTLKRMSFFLVIYFTSFLYSFVISPPDNNAKIIILVKLWFAKTGLQTMVDNISSSCSHLFYIASKVNGIR